LPFTQYFEYISDFKIIFPNAFCTTTFDGFCKLPSPCSGYSELNQYSFQILFKSSANFMRVPLAAFAQTLTGQCNINVVQVEGQSQIVLGTNFFQ